MVLETHNLGDLNDGVKDAVRKVGSRTYQLWVVCACENDLGKRCYQ